jgi:hypothetical protein
MTRTTKVDLALALFVATVFTVGLTSSVAVETSTPLRSTARSDEVRVFYKRVQVGGLDIFFREAGRS